MISGLTVTFVIAIVGIASVIDGVGLAKGFTRTLAIAALVLFGAALIWPRLAEVVERPFTRLTRFGPSTSGSGFWSGVLVGAALGFLYAPCAGPILAAVISVAATSGASGDLIAVAIGYGVGSAIVLLAIAYGGRSVLGRLRSMGRGLALQRTLGAVMIATALAMSFDLDLRFQTVLANDVPSFVANPTGALERSDAVEDRLAGLRGRSKFDTRRAPASTTVAAKGYPVLGEAPDFAGPGPWLNTPASRPLSLAGLRGRVILVDFWTYTCINCLRTLPHVRAWDARYARQGLTIVGVHTPEFPFEKDTDNVMRAISRNGLRYPVLQDNDYATWTAWGNQYWPAKYLVDSQGRVRYTHFGEGDYGATEKAIRALLRERGTRSLGGYTRVTGEVAAAGTSTPETYLGYERARGFVPGAAAQGVHSYPPSRPPSAKPVRACGRLARKPGLRNRSPRLRALGAFRRAEGVPRAQLAGRSPAHGTGAARRTSHRRARGRRGCPRGPAAREEPAPLPARLAAPRRGPHASARAAPGGHGLRVHLRVGSPWAFERTKEDQWPRRRSRGWPREARTARAGPSRCRTRPRAR